MKPIIYWEACRPGVVMPKQAKPGDAGFDLAAATDVWIWPGQTLAVPTGIKLVLPADYEIQIRPRSGLSLRTFLRIPNSPGTIDPGYRDEVRIILHHAGFGFGDDQPADAELAALLRAARDEENVFDPSYAKDCSEYCRRRGIEPHSYRSRELRWAPYHISGGDRIAQAIPRRLTPVTWRRIEEAETSSSGDRANYVPDRRGGFASSGYGSSDVADKNDGAGL